MNTSDLLEQLLRAGQGSMAQQGGAGASAQGGLGDRCWNGLGDVPGCIWSSRPGAVPELALAAKT